MSVKHPTRVDEKLEFHDADTGHRHGHPREDPRRHVRHARFPEVIPMASSTTRRYSRDDPREDVGEDVGVVECQLNDLSAKRPHPATV